MAKGGKVRVFLGGRIYRGGGKYPSHDVIFPNQEAVVGRDRPWAFKTGDSERKRERDEKKKVLFIWIQAQTPGRVALLRLKKSDLTPRIGP